AIDSVGNEGTASFSWTIAGPPDTTITAKPSPLSNSTAADFTYVSSDNPATFECKLDGALFSNCNTTQPMYSGLAQGSHTFQVRATAAGGIDTTPASYTWTIDSIAPHTTITPVATV